MIRKAKKEDMKQVCELIYELAAFEKLANQVKITPETLEIDGFSDNPTFGCLVAEVSNTIVGYTLYYTCYSSWLGKSLFLEDLYVKEAFRKQGLGKKLFIGTAKIAKETSGRMDFHVLGWNPAISFYEKQGAFNLTHLEKWELYRLDGETLKMMTNNA